MSERDELLRLLNDNITDDIAIRPLRCDIRAQVEQATDAVLAAGYRKPRTITTAGELDALPVGAIVHGRILAQKWAEPEGEVWHVAGKGMPWSITQMVKFGALPATVLWEPGAI